MRLDGAELDQYGDDLGKYVGYLPQEVILFDGTVAENIARFSLKAKDEDIVDAAKRTGAHEMILELPGGYDFQVSAGGAALSGGQHQRIALARAFYGSPVVVVMDEPDSNLDAEGTMALARAVEGQKKHGGAVLIVAHRHGAFAQCDTVYVMENGRPVPATGGERGRAAPVRQLQSGGAQRTGGAGAPQAPPAHSRQRPQAPAALAGRGGPPPPAPPAPGREGTPARAASGGGEDPRPPAPPARGRDAQIAGAVERVRSSPPPGADENQTVTPPPAPQGSAQARRPAGDGGRADAPASAASGQASESRDGRDAQIAGAITRVSGSALPAVARENEGTGAPPAPERGEASSGNSAKRGDAS